MMQRRESKIPSFELNFFSESDKDSLKSLAVESRIDSKDRLSLDDGNKQADNLSVPSAQSSAGAIESSSSKNFNKKELKKVLGQDPEKEKNLKLNLAPEIAKRIESWVKDGLKEEQREKLLNSLPRSGDIDLEAPIINDYIEEDMSEAAKLRDKKFVENHNRAASALSAVSLVVQDIMQDQEVPLERITVLNRLGNATKLLGDLLHEFNITRRSFIAPGYKRKYRKLLEDTKPTKYLFGDDLESQISKKKNQEKTAKDIKLQPRGSQYSQKPQHRPYRNSLNWRGSPNNWREANSGNQPARDYASKKHRPAPSRVFRKASAQTHPYKSNNAHRNHRKQ